MTNQAGFADRFRQWATTPAPLILVALVALALLILPGWLLWDDLQGPLLRGDDFAFLIDCRTGARPFDNLFQPHNTHIVPGFRLLTAAIARFSPTPGDVALVASAVNYGALALLLAITGHVAARAANRVSIGLFTQAFVGISTVLRPAAIWYSAGQTFWAALGCMMVLALVQIRSRRFAGVRVGLAVAVVVGSTAFWGGGAVSGLVGAAYALAASGRAGWKGAAALALASTLVLVGLAALTLGASPVREGASARAPDAADSFHPLRAVTHTAQAIPEKLLAPSLGLDTQTTPVQGLLFTGGLIALWAATAGRKRPVRPLEAAGAVLVFASYGIAFALRSQYAYENLRNLGWYDTLPQVGFGLFLAGWLTPERVQESGRDARGPQRVTWGAVLGLAAFVLVQLGLQVPRAEKLLIQDAPEMSESESERFPIPELKRLWSRFVLSELAAQQRTTMIRLGLAAAEARKLGISREAIRRVHGPVSVPNWPQSLTNGDGLDLFDFPPDTQPSARPPLSVNLRNHLQPVGLSRPEWLAPGDPWPPRPKAGS